jgi:benzil reductase ((S)-benzoin forming)
VADVIVWITGASSGLGAALVRTAPFDDCRIIDISRSGGTPGTEHLAADLADPASWAVVEQHLRDEIAGFVGRRVVLVHCAAAIEPLGFAGIVDSAAYQRSVLLNSAAPQVLGQVFLSATWGIDAARSLLLISSGVARTPYAGATAYCAGKAAVDGWARAAALEQGAPSRCQVLAVNPGAVATPLLDRICAAGDEDFPAVGRFRELAASRRAQDPHAAARAVWRLLHRDPEAGALADIREQP